MTGKCLKVVSRFQECVHQLDPLTMLVYYCYLVCSWAVRKWQLFMGFEHRWALRQNLSRSLKQFWSFCRAAPKTLFFQGIFVYFRNGSYRMLWLVWLFTSRKVILSDPLNIKVGTNWELAVPSYLNAWLGALNLIPRSKLSTPKSPTSITEVAQSAALYQVQPDLKNPASSTFLQQQACAAKLDSVLLGW